MLIYMIVRQEEDVGESTIDSTSGSLQARCLYHGVARCCAARGALEEQVSVTV